MQLKDKNASVPSGARPRRRLLGGALRSALVVASRYRGLVLGEPARGRVERGAGTGGQPGAGPSGCAGPARPADPCASSLAATAVTAAGTAEAGNLAAFGVGVEVRLLLRLPDRTAWPRRPTPAWR